MAQCADSGWRGRACRRPDFPCHLCNLRPHHRAGYHLLLPVPAVQPASAQRIRQRRGMARQPLANLSGHGPLADSLDRNAAVGRQRGHTPLARLEVMAGENPKGRRYADRLGLGSVRNRVLLRPDLYLRRSALQICLHCVGHCLRRFLRLGRAGMGKASRANRDSHGSLGRMALCRFLLARFRRIFARSNYFDRAVPLRACGRMAAGSAPGRRRSCAWQNLRGADCPSAERPPAQTGGGPSRKTEPAQARNSHGQLHAEAGRASQGRLPVIAEAGRASQGRLPVIRQGSPAATSRQPFHNSLSSSRITSNASAT
jgi:hypothetical protein